MLAPFVYALADSVVCANLRVHDQYLVGRSGAPVLCLNRATGELVWQADAAPTPFDPRSCVAVYHVAQPRGAASVSDAAEKVAAKKVTGTKFDEIGDSG